MPCDTYILHGATQRFALPALGRAAERRPIGKMPRRRKMLENAAESPASGARFVRRGFALLNQILRQDNAVKFALRLSQALLHLFQVNYYLDEQHLHYS